MQQNNKQVGHGLATEQFELLDNLMAATASNSSNSDNKMLTEIMKRFETLVKPVTLQIAGPALFDIK
jgi:hypothetical protein